MRHFLSGNFDTHFVKNYYTPEKIKEKQKANAEIAAMVALKYWMEKQKIINPVKINLPAGKEDWLSNKVVI